jgi:hypothetical protein
MKNKVLIFFTLFSYFNFFAIEVKNDNQIKLKVVFENNTFRNFKYGELEIIELNKVIEINSTDEILITLPKKGKYHFTFKTPNFKVNIEPFLKISTKNKTLKIILNDKSLYHVDKLLLAEQIDNENLESKIELGEINFGVNAITNNSNANYKSFEKKYGIGFVVENCVVNNIMYNKFRINNKIIIKYLNEKYGKKVWIEDLPLILLGGG